MAAKRGKSTMAKEKCCTTEGGLNLPEEVEKELCRLGGLEELIDSLPDEKGLRKVAIQNNALSDLIRLRILAALARCDLCPCVLKEITGLSDSRLSYHLNVLEETGLVSQSSKGRWRIYRLTEEGRRRTKD